MPPPENIGGRFPLFGVLSVVVLLAGGYYGYLKTLGDSSASEEPWNSMGIQPMVSRDEVEGAAEINALNRPAQRNRSPTFDRVQDSNQTARIETLRVAEPELPTEPDQNQTGSLSDAEIAKYVSLLEVNLFATSWCGYCQKARAFFSANGIRYHEYDVERDTKAKARKDELSPGGGVPVVEIDGSVVGGFNPHGYAVAIERSIAKASGVPVQVSFRFEE